MYFYLPVAQNCLFNIYISKLGPMSHTKYSWWILTSMRGAGPVVYAT